MRSAHPRASILGTPPTNGRYYFQIQCSIREAARRATQKLRSPDPSRITHMPHSLPRHSPATFLRDSVNKRGRESSLASMSKNRAKVRDY